MKINGPALGHSVTSLDPAGAPNATARQEIEKLNLAPEMGNNVLLYVDDIQHTHPEFLPKFISLCDAQRKVEGVWKGRTRTYDLRGKKLVVCMAGNPHTESGAKFQIPDMLANRADTYNLGDILEGKDDLFGLFYIENSLTSNRVLAPLTTRDPGDVDKLVRMARGEPIQVDQLSHPYSAVELSEILSVLEKLVRVQQTLLRINQQYILSASQQDAYRTEPPFKLQGSYRNMNKLAEKIVAAMDDEELETPIDDQVPDPHRRGRKPPEAGRDEGPNDARPKATVGGDQEGLRPHPADGKLGRRPREPVDRSAQHRLREARGHQREHQSAPSRKPPRDLPMGSIPTSAPLPRLHRPCRRWT